MSPKSNNNLQGRGSWIMEHQRVWWPVYSFLFMMGIWLVSMSILLVFPALGDKSNGHVTGYDERCDTNSAGNTDCDPYSVVTFPDSGGRTHWTSGDADLPLGKEMLVNYLPWGNPPIAAYAYDVSAGEKPRGFLSTGIVLFITIILMCGLVWASLTRLLRHRMGLTEAQQVVWWSEHMDIEANENGLIRRKISNKLQPGETISQIYRINPFIFATKNQPGKLDAFGLGIGGLIWYGLSIGLDLSSTGWAHSFKSLVLNTGISLIGVVMMIPFVINIFLGISSRLIVTNLRKILFIGNRLLFHNTELANKEPQ